MIFISHRGNTSKREINSENNPNYLVEALSKGFDVEMDIWLKKDKWYLGHDKPEYEVPFSWLSSNSKFWLHCKNIAALTEMHNFSVNTKRKFNFFWHDQDKFTLTSNSYIWANVGVELNIKCSKAIAVMPELSKKKINFTNYSGICSDKILLYKNKIKI